MSTGDVWFENASGLVTPFRALDRGYMVLDEIGGVDLPPAAFTTQALYNRDGSLLQQVRFQERNVTIPFGVLGANVGQVRERVRALSEALTPTQDGTLYLQAPGSPLPRALTCRLTAGLDGQVELLDDGGEAWEAMVLNFRAFDPWWFDPIGHELTFGFAVDVGKPFFPMFADPANVGPHFGSSSLFADQVATNEGPGLARPIWTLTGPLNGPKLVNLTTGAVMDFNANGGLNILAGHTVTIDTTSSYITAIDNNTGASVLTYLTNVSVPFGLVPGDNVLHAEGGAASAASLVVVNYAARWLSA